MQVNHLLVNTGRSEAIARLRLVSDDDLARRLEPYHFVADSFPDPSAADAWRYAIERGSGWDLDDPEVDLICRGIRAELAADINIVCGYDSERRDYIEGEYVYSGLDNDGTYLSLVSYLTEDDAEDWVQHANPVTRLNTLRLMGRRPPDWMQHDVPIPAAPRRRYAYAPIIDSSTATWSTNTTGFFIEDQPAAQQPYVSDRETLDRLTQQWQQASASVDDLRVSLHVGTFNDDDDVDDDDDDGGFDSGDDETEAAREDVW